jgi:hypothetical protein
MAGHPHPLRRKRCGRRGAIHRVAHRRDRPSQVPDDPSDEQWRSAEQPKRDRALLEENIRAQVVSAFPLLNTQPRAKEREPKTHHVYSAPDKGQTLDPSVKSRKCILIAQSRGLQQPQFTPFFGRFGKITENRFDKTFVACLRRLRYERKRRNWPLLVCSMADGGKSSLSQDSPRPCRRDGSLKKGALICSVNPVEDFSVTYDATRGVEILSYAEPSGGRFDA